MLIIPAIDLRGGRCVRLTQGDYAREKIYDALPSEVATRFEGEGAKLIHVVDLEGAKLGSPPNLDSVEAICRAVSIPIEFGGGVRSLETAHRVLDLGAARVVLGSRLVASLDAAKELFAELGEKAVAGIDAREGKVAVEGWLETSELVAADFARRLEGVGARRFIVTDIARDGALLGPNFEFLASMLKAVSSPVIASGGVASLSDLEALCGLSSSNLEGVIVGKAIYEGRFSVKEAIALLN